MLLRQPVLNDIGPSVYLFKSVRGVIPDEKIPALTVKIPHMHKQNPCRINLEATSTV